MTPKTTLDSKRWKTPLLLCLAFLVMCQVVEAYPQRGASIDPAVGFTKARNEDGSQGSPNVTTLIERAYKNHELLRPEQWTRVNGRTGQIKNPVQRDTSKQQATTVESTNGTSAVLKSQQEANSAAQGQRRLLENREEPAMDASFQSDGKIVFPTDDGMMHQSHNLNPKTVPICRGTTFCENVDYYPGYLVNEAIERNNTLKYLASIDEVSDIVQRIDASDETPLCVSNEKLIYPQTAENKRKEWLFVVNQDDFKQGVRIETCNEKNTECSVIDGFSEAYRTTCKQKYIYRQLAAVGNDGAIVPDMFRFPSSCCCHVQFIGESLLRVNVHDVERSNQSATLKNRKRK